MKPAKKQKPRTCVACRGEAPKGLLLRVARSPAGEVFFDERGRLPGRGAYICLKPECLERAKKTGAIARALKTAITDDLYARIAEKIESAAKARREGWKDADDTLIKKELSSLLGLARRAGLVYIGLDSVQLKRAKEPILILTARDCSASVSETARKCGALAVRCSIPLGISEISNALGANNVQVVALSAVGGVADKVRALLAESGAAEDDATNCSAEEGGVALEQNESLRACQTSWEKQ
ncbi:hypothetical protein AGMMS50276_25960 [Synergistales bacterium]|nr:hypothetical protein AGMMS50276_25960 [Synergistales bacterium]